MEVLVEDLLGTVVDVPNAETVVVDGHQLVVGLVEEADLVGNVHTDSVSTDSLSGVDLI